ncbi:MAG: dihydrofolate reductase [Planctomycetota bacterium]
MTKAIENHRPPRRVSLIAAMSENRVIGKDNALPWHLPHEMAQFRAYTLGHAVITGRKNFEAGDSKPLPYRRNLVLTTRPDWSPPEEVRDAVEVCHGLDEALDRVGDSDPEPYVIGGAQVYALAIPVVDRMVLSTVHAELDGDTFFPDYDEAAWDLTDERHHPADARHAYAFTVRTFDRRP